MTLIIVGKATQTNEDPLPCVFLGCFLWGIQISFLFICLLHWTVQSEDAERTKLRQTVAMQCTCPCSCILMLSFGVAIICHLPNRQIHPCVSWLRVSDCTSSGSPVSMFLNAKVLQEQMRKKHHDYSMTVDKQPTVHECLERSSPGAFSVAQFAIVLWSQQISTVSIRKLLSKQKGPSNPDSYWPSRMDFKRVAGPPSLSQYHRLLMQRPCFRSPVTWMWQVVECSRSPITPVSPFKHL